MPIHYDTYSQYTSEECRSNMEKGVGNLVDTYAKGTRNELRLGLAWYGDALADAMRISTTYDVDIVTVVKVACAMSPRMPWEQNMAAVEWIIREFQAGCWVPDIQLYVDKQAYIGRVNNDDPDRIVFAEDDRCPSPPMGGLKANVIKALWILQGHDWVLRGNKVNSFLDNILNHKTSMAVTVDSHAIQVWFGSINGGAYQVPDNFYNIIAADYVRAAEIVGLSPLDFQATVWIIKKRLGKNTTRK